MDAENEREKRHSISMMSDKSVWKGLPSEEDQLQLYASPLTTRRKARALPSHLRRKC